MSVLSVSNINEYKEKYANELEARSIEIGKPITDEMLTKAVFNKIVEKADVDYYSFYKSFNPEGKYTNLETYRVATNDMDSNDTDLVNKAYDELRNIGQVRFKNFVNVFSPKKRDIVEEIGFPLFGVYLDEPEYSVKEIAEMRGINPDTDVNLTEIGFAQGLARDDINEAMAAKEVLNRHFGEDIPIRLGEETEQLEFLNPDTGKYELLNKFGLDEGDLAKFGTYGVFVLPEIAATVVASGLFPGSGIAASAVSSAALETARLIAGHEIYGINKTEEGFMDYLKNEGKDIAIINSTLTAAGYTIPKLYRMFKDLRRFGKIEN